MNREQTLIKELEEDIVSYKKRYDKAKLTLDAINLLSAKYKKLHFTETVDLEKMKFNSPQVYQDFDEWKIYQHHLYIGLKLSKTEKIVIDNVEYNITIESEPDWLGCELIVATNSEEGNVWIRNLPCALKKQRKEIFQEYKKHFCFIAKTYRDMKIVPQSYPLPEGFQEILAFI